VQQHPDVSSFNTVERARDEDYDEDEGTGVDAVEKELLRRRLELYPHITQFRSEGVFLQDVLPKFSLHHPWWPYYPKKTLYLLLLTYAPAVERFLKLRENLGGLAEYAFMESSHLTETHPLACKEAAARLFKQWATIWDLRRQILVEKSPSNVRTSRLLNKMWASLGGSARFIFVTRHPLMQALALQEGGFATESLYELVEHWVAIEESLAGDLALLPDSTYRKLHLEDVAKGPLVVMDDLYAWMGLASIADLQQQGRASAVIQWAAAVSPDPDDKYRTLYRKRLSDSPKAASEHARILRDFAARVRAISRYELEDWCRASSDGVGFNEPCPA